MRVGSHKVWSGIDNLWDCLFDRPYSQATSLPCQTAGTLPGYMRLMPLASGGDIDGLASVLAHHTVSRAVWAVEVHIPRSRFKVELVAICTAEIARAITIRCRERQHVTRDLQTARPRIGKAWQVEAA